MSVFDKFFNHEISFWKQKNKIYVIFFCVYIIELQSCGVTVYVALELCSRFLQTWIFFWMFLKGIKKLLKWGALECNHVVLQNSCAYNFFSNQVYSKNRKTVCQEWSLSKLIWFFQCKFFYWGFLFVCKTTQNLNAVWAINSYSFSFIFWLSCMD